MDWLYKVELDNKIQQLASRRRILEKQLEIRSATISELQTLRQASLQRVYQAVEDQNIQALARNKAIREELHCSVSQSIPFKMEQRLSNSSTNLKEAKRQYYRHIEAKLPVLHRCQTIQMEERVRAIQLEKEMSVRRQEQLRLELARENEVKYKLERHRQDLMNSLASEQKIVLESKANSILLEEERKTADARVLHTIAQATQQTKDQLYENVLRMRHESQELENQAYWASNYHPESVAQRVPTREGTECMYTRPTSNTTATTAGNTTKEVHVVNKNKPNTKEEEYQYKQQQSNRQGTLILSEVESVGIIVPTGTAAANTNPFSSATSTTEEVRISTAAEHVMSPSTASAYTPHSRGISTTPAHTLSTSNNKPHSDAMPTGVYNNSFQAQVGDQESKYSDSQTRISPGKYTSVTHNSSSSPTSRLFGSIKETKEEEEEEVILTLPTSYHHSSSHTSSPVGKTTSFMQSPFNTESNSNKSHTSASATANTTNPTSTSATKYMDEKQQQQQQQGSNHFSWSENHTYSSPPRSPTQSTLASPHTTTIHPNITNNTTATTTTTNHHSNTSEQHEKEVSFQSNHSFSFDTESMKKHSFGGSENSRLHSSQSEISTGSSKQTGLDINLLINNLTITQSTVLLQLLSTTIENRLISNSTTNASNITTIYDTSTRHRAAHIIDAFHSSTSIEDAHLTAILHNAADSTLGNAVLAIAEGKSDSLIPKDAFTGVMTLEKLRKEYKRIGPAGVVQLWEMLTAHLQRLVAHKSNSLDFLSTCFTSALTVHVEEEEDRSRLERKVSHLLQLALIPPENKDQRSPSPPYRTRGQLHSPDATAAAGGQYQRSNPLDPNMSSISYSTAPDSTPVKAPEQKFSTGTVPTTTAAVTSSSSQQGLWPSPANKNNSNTTHNSSTSINNSSSSPVRGGQTGIVATAGHNNPALSTMYAKASIALRSHRTAAEFDDDEIADDESIGAPPALRDLDTTFENTKKKTALNASDSTVSDRSSLEHRGDDEFDF